MPKSHYKFCASFVRMIQPQLWRKEKKKNIPNNVRVISVFYNYYTIRIYLSLSLIKKGMEPHFYSLKVILVPPAALLTSVVLFSTLGSPPSSIAEGGKP